MSKRLNLLLPDGGYAALVRMSKRTELPIRFCITQLALDAERVWLDQFPPQTPGLR